MRVNGSKKQTFCSHVTLEQFEALVFPDIKINISVTPI